MFYTLFIMTALLSRNAFSQSDNSWEKWSWLMGEWEGEGSGQPGSGGGSFSFRKDLDNKILMRTNHSDYPATNDRPAINHNDIMIIYPGSNSTRAIYFDNEGHVINYAITLSNKAVTFISDRIQNMPVFKLSYSLVNPQSVIIKFEMSQDGETFKTYLEGSASKR
jgi:hypothetical protein